MQERPHTTMSLVEPETKSPLDTTETKKTTPSSTSIYSRYKLPSGPKTDSHNSSPEYKRSFTLDSLSSIGSSSDSISTWKTPTPSTSTLTPSAAIRNQYYQSHHYLQDYSIGSHTNDNASSRIPSPRQRLYSQDSSSDTTSLEAGDDLIYRSSSAAYVAQKPSNPPSLHSFSDAGSIISLRTEYNDLDDARSISSIQTVGDFRGNAHQRSSHTTTTKVSRSGTIFRSKTGAEPKIVVEDGSGSDHPPHQSSDRDSIRSTSGASLLSRLSRSTAPMRAKLSAMSRTGKMDQLRHLRADTSFSMSLPLRRSAESVYNMPVTPRRYGHRIQGERSQSFSFGNETPVTIVPVATKETLPVIYPALLSKVAEAMKERVTVATRTKDSIKYKEAFDGREAVDKLAQLIKTKDRNLAILLGRALDAQKFFHDVNYEHRLRDSPSELYQFREHINVRPQSQLLAYDEETLTPYDDEDRSELKFPVCRKDDDEGLPNGVFTVLTDCYSPTCTRDKLCYSVFCPRRLEQQARRTAARSHQRSNSQCSFTEQDDRLWINNVPREISEKLSHAERKRQENIFELIYTEKDFVDDLAYLNKYWINPLLEGNMIPSERRQEFVHSLFWNIMEIHSVNLKLLEALQKAQSMHPVVHKVGSVMLNHVGQFQPFVHYGAHQMISKYIFETEKSTNPEFAKFVQTTERLAQSRKLELNGYLTKPTTRLGRYNLLLREILKHTPRDHPDQTDIPKAMSIISEFLSSVNTETGKAENRFNLQLLEERLMYKGLSDFDLDLGSESRQIVMKGTLKKKGSGSESSDLTVFLLDHCLLVTKQKFIRNEEKYKLQRKPIPLPLLSISLPDQTNKRASTIIPYGRPSTGSTSLSSLDIPLQPSGKTGYPISLVHLGKQGTGPITLYATTMASRRQWVEKIETQRQALVDKQKVFDVVPISEKFFSSFNKVNCIATFDHGNHLVLGSDQGVYLKKNNQKGTELVRILAMEKVSQIDVLEGPKLILVLADKTLYTYSLETLLSHESGIKRGRKISSHVSFFKVGKILDKNDPDKPTEKTLVCFVRFNAITSTIRALEPYENTDPKKKSKHNFGRLIRGSNEVLKIYKDLYIPGEASSLQFFKNIICVGSARGFQMVNISSAEVQSVLDPTDDQNKSVLQRESLKPISMFRHRDGNILLCYNEMAFYIDKKGRRVRDDWAIYWEGSPSAFAFRFPYIVAFNANFIEVRHINTGDLVQVIPGNDIRCLRPDSNDTIHGVMDDRVAGTEVIFELKLVDNSLTTAILQ
ncbi:CNH domain-containing protein [Radiomyces spectabilis]|uniref:CNH domain-containing protein n=1 Tax=Radiomyces spectabilis TaxID=64574 RepID=UPI00221FEB68|nr:CNH domain-containing protein [Radiomyces spectabilis]KAI8388193.1 CNH domain-containing protein [Radiomyces spectabilis]